MKWRWVSAEQARNGGRHRRTMTRCRRSGCEGWRVARIESGTFVSATCPPPNSCPQLACQPLASPIAVRARTHRPPPSPSQIPHQTNAQQPDQQERRRTGPRRPLSEQGPATAYEGWAPSGDVRVGWATSGGGDGVGEGGRSVGRIGGGHG